MSAGSAPALQFSPRQKHLLQAMGYTLWQPVQRLPAANCLAVEMDSDAVASPVVSAMLSFAGLDIARARTQALHGGRVTLSWELPGAALVLPGTSALRSAAVKRSVWPALRALRRTLASS